MTSYSFSYVAVDFRVEFIITIMLFLPVVAPLTVAVAATVATLTASSLRNMWQTRVTLIDFKNHNNNNLNHNDDKHSSSSSSYSSSSYSSSSSSSLHPSSLSLFHWTSTEECVHELRNMKRKQLLELFLQCPAPQSLEQVQGEWNGDLLDNHSRMMVRT
jgi:hypothetical protein